MNEGSHPTRFQRISAGGADAPAGVPALPADRTEMGSEVFLREWQAAPRTPVTDSATPECRAFLQAIQQKQTVEFTYYGGSDCGLHRRVRPAELFRVEGYHSIYLTGFCEVRQASRTFRLDGIWMEGVSPSPKPTSNPRPKIRHVSKFVHRTLRQRWETELKMPFPLLPWNEMDAFLRENPEALLWIIADWDGPARMVVMAIFQSLGADIFSGLPVRALDFDESMGANWPVKGSGREYW